MHRPRPQIICSGLGSAPTATAHAQNVLHSETRSKIRPKKIRRGRGGGHVRTIHIYIHIYIYTQHDTLASIKECTSASNSASALYSMEGGQRTSVKVGPAVVICLILVLLAFFTATRYVRKTGMLQKITELANDTYIHDASKLGYLVIVEASEQLTSAVENFVQLYMINTLHWKLGMIEPYVLGTQLAFLPPVTEDLRSLPLLSTYFNRSHMMHNLKECFHSDVELNTFEDFLINAARPLIVLNFVTDKTLAKEVSKCSFLMSRIEYPLNYHVQRVKEEAMAMHGLNYQFVGVCSLCIRSHPQKPFSMLRVVKYVREWMMKASGQPIGHYTPHHTVVIQKWDSIRNKPGHHYYYDPSFTAPNFTDSCRMRSVSHSSYVKDIAGRVLDTLALPRPLIAFHVRSEQVASHERKNHVKGSVKKCIELLPRVLRAIQNMYNVSHDHIIFIHDGTEYGSTSMKSYNRKPLSTEIISKVKALGIRNVQYKPLHNTQTDLAAPQFVEQEILVSADVLILVGSGSFQKSLLTRFRDKVNVEGKWYKMCSGPTEEDHLEGLDL